MSRSSLLLGDDIHSDPKLKRLENHMGLVLIHLGRRWGYGAHIRALFGEAGRDGTWAWKLRIVICFVLEFS